MESDVSLLPSYLAVMVGGVAAFAIVRSTAVHRVVAALLGTVIGVIAWFLSPLLVGGTPPSSGDDWFEAAVFIWGIFAAGCAAVGAFLGGTGKH